MLFEFIEIVDKKWDKGSFKDLHDGCFAVHRRILKLLFFRFSIGNCLKLDILFKKMFPKNRTPDILLKIFSERFEFETDFTTETDLLKINFGFRTLTKHNRIILGRIIFCSFFKRDSNSRFLLLLLCTTGFEPLVFLFFFFFYF